MQGYYAGLKCTVAGLYLVSDMSVSCFLTGGHMVNVMWQVGGYRNLEDMMRDANTRGLPKRFIDSVNEVIKNAKVSLIHIGHYRKVRALGPVASSKESQFEVDGKPVTVADYFAQMCRSKEKGANYKRVLSTGRLQFPNLPTINVGTSSKPVWVPPELVMIPGGQVRSRAQAFVSPPP